MASFQDFWHLQTFKNSLADGEPLDVLLKDALRLLLGPCVLIRLMQLPLSPLSKAQAWDREAIPKSTMVTIIAKKTSVGTKAGLIGQHREYVILVQGLCDNQQFLEKAHLDNIVH